jgi:molybdenum cofactor cytidylyltransferase
MKKQTGIVVLAAGNSSRMGKAKQLLTYQGESLLRRSAMAALNSACDPVLIVLGAMARPNADELQNLRVNTVINRDWEEGMASSIRCGLTELLTINDTISGVVLMLCDQPHINPQHINTLLLKAETSGKGIVSSSYQDILGTPVLFSKQYFAELLDLKGKEGAKRLLSKYSEDLATVEFPLGAIDIDTPEDYMALQNEDIISIKRTD